MIFQTIDGIEYKMAKPFDLSFLSKYGKVFHVYDDQDSGNLCFGVEQDGQKRFIKFAGAPTAEYEGSLQDAIDRLKKTIPIYEQIHHENLIRYRGFEEIGGGFAMIFDWVDAECMGKQYPQSRERFFTLPIKTRLKVFDVILSFLQSVILQGYVVIDFYDGSVLYDFDHEKTVICDIDFFERAPFINETGRMWGSSRFMAPEEFIKGAQIDEVTHIFLAGAFAFALFGGETDRSRNLWRLSDTLYAVALKAVSEHREDRYDSFDSFIQAWNHAKKEQDLL